MERVRSTPIASPARLRGRRRAHRVHRRVRERLWGVRQRRHQGVSIARSRDQGGRLQTRLRSDDRRQHTGIRRACLRLGVQRLRQCVCRRHTSRSGLGRRRSGTRRERGRHSYGRTLLPGGPAGAQGRNISWRDQDRLSHVAMTGPRWHRRQSRRRRWLRRPSSVGVLVNIPTEPLPEVVKASVADPPILVRRGPTLVQRVREAVVSELRSAELAVIVIPVWA